MLFCAATEYIKNRKRISKRLKMYKIIAILMSISLFTGACANNSEPANNPEQPQESLAVEAEPAVAVEEPQVVDEEPAEVAETSSDDFPQTLGYTQQPPTVDPAKGYFVDEIADGIFWVYGSFYQAMFLTTGEGVIVVDAPQPIGPSYLEAIREVTDEPVTHVIYSHSHGDHIGSAGIFPPDAEYIAHQNTVNFLSGVPAPTITFEDTYTLEVGDQRLELSYIGTFHSVGDTVVYAPRQKVLMVADLFHPGSAPFAGFGASIDLATHIEVHDVLLEEYDFNVLVAGHTAILGTKAHLETNKAFVLSLREIVEQAIESGPSSEVIQTCVAIATEQWGGILANVPDRVDASCQAMESFVSS